MDVDTVADELYGLRPDEFTRTRNERAAEARARDQKDLAKRIGRLRKPTASAWVVNLLTREESEQVDQLLRLGEELRAAQGQLQGQQLRELSQRRSQVVSALAQEGQRLARQAGHAVSGAVAREVEGTLEAALADPDAAAGVRSGRLTSALSYSGLGPVATSTVRDGRRDRRAQPPEGAQQSLREAQENARWREDERDRARAREEDLRSRKEAADERGAELGRELDHARDAAASATTQLTEAARERERADRELAAAHRRVEHAEREMGRSP